MNDQQRAAMQMALDLLEMDEKYPKRIRGSHPKEVITALRSALAQPQGEPVAYIKHFRPSEGGHETDLEWNKDDDLDGLYYYEPLYTTPPVVPPGEPVYAFRRKGLDDFCTCDEGRYLELSDKPNLFETTIFYTTPPSVEAMRIETLEKAAKVCEIYEQASTTENDIGMAMVFQHCAAAIRGMK